MEERKKIAEVWAGAVKETSQHLMIQVGGASLKDVRELVSIHVTYFPIINLKVNFVSHHLYTNSIFSKANHAESIGADSILCLPELYFKPTTACELADYLRLVGESAPKTPLFYYDFPKASNVNGNHKIVK